MEKELKLKHLEYKRCYTEDGKLIFEGFVHGTIPRDEGTLYWGNGNIYMEGIFGPKGLIQGREYYPDGRLRFEGRYRYNRGYGPNFPGEGKIYNRDGNLIYEGKISFRRGGVGYPYGCFQCDYGPVVQDGRPRITEKCVWSETMKTKTISELLDQNVLENMMTYDEFRELAAECAAKKYHLSESDIGLYMDKIESIIEELYRNGVVRYKKSFSNNAFRYPMKAVINVMSSAKEKMISYNDFCKTSVDDVVKEFGYSTTEVEDWIEENKEYVEKRYNDGVFYYERSGNNEKAFSSVLNGLEYLIHMDIYN